MDFPTPGDPATEDAWGPPLVRATKERSFGSLLAGEADEHFTTDSDDTLPAGWSIQGSYVGADYEIKDSWLKVNNGRAVGSYFYRACPAGDWTAIMRAVALTSTTACMFGLMCMDDTGLGVFSGWYNASPDVAMVGALAAGPSYGSAFQNPAESKPKGTIVSDGHPMWYRLRKSGTNYYAAFSLNGAIWGSETPAQSRTFTPTRIGVGSVLGTCSKWAVDLFDVT